MKPLVCRCVLHLQCYFRLDSLSLPRLRARVTGVDACEAANDGDRRRAVRFALHAEVLTKCRLLIDVLLERSFALLLACDGDERWCWLKVRRGAALIMAVRAIKPGSAT